MKQRLLGGGSRFAHLAFGLGRAKAEDDRDDEETKGKTSKAADDEDDEDDRRDDDKESRKSKGKKSKAAGDEDEDEDEDDKDDAPKGKKSKAAGDEDEDEDEDEPKGRKSKAADDDDEDDDKEEMNGKSAIARARRREQARCAAIFASRAAGRNPELAASLAFDTRLTRKEAVKVLEGQSRSPFAGSRGRDRSDRNPNLDHRGGPRGGDVQASWGEAFAAVIPQAKGARKNMRSVFEDAARGR